MDGEGYIEQLPESSMPFGGRVIRLLGPSSQQLRLVAEKELSMWWQPTAAEGAELGQREAFEIEIRARITGTTADNTGPAPVVTWSSEMGHGQDVWEEPFPMLENAAPFGQEPFNLPGRGMVVRTAAREFRIAFRNTGDLAGDPIAEIRVQVTILPVWGGSRQAYTYSDVAFPFGASPHPFPMTAREWRLTDSIGLPLTGAETVFFLTVNGSAFGLGPASAFGGDWFPIPHDAVAWVPDAPMYAAYRALP